MSKKCLFSFLSFCAFTALSLTVMHLFLLLNLNQWVGVGCGAGIFVCALVIIFLLRKKLKQHAYFTLNFVPFNAVACGMSFSSLFVHLGEYPLVWESAAVWGALTAGFAFYCFCTNLRIFRDHYLFCMIAYAVLLLAGAVTGLCISSTVVFSLALITLVIFYGFFMTLAVKASFFAEHMHHIAVATFSLLLVVIIVVLMVISEGEGAEGFDFAPSGGKKLKRNPYIFEP